MSAETTKAEGLKQRLKKELLEYLAISAYLCAYFSALLNYKRVVLADVGIHYEQYGYAIVEALVLGKVILIGEALKIGRGYQSRPLIVSALYKSLMVGGFVLSFLVVEHVFRVMVKGESIVHAIEGTFDRPAALVAHVIFVIRSLVPFFLLREAGRHMGEERLLKLLWHRPGSPNAVSGGPIQQQTGTHG